MILTILLPFLARLFTARHLREAVGGSEGGVISYTFIWRILLAVASAGSLFLAIALLNLLLDPPTTLWFLYLIGPGFFLVAFIASFLFLLETFRTMYYSSSGIVLYMAFRKKRVMQWNKIISITYLNKQLTFYDDAHTEISIPVNLAGVGFFISFAEEHVDPGVKDRFQFTLQSAHEVAESQTSF